MGKSHLAVPWRHLETRMDRAARARFCHSWAIALILTLLSPGARAHAAPHAAPRADVTEIDIDDLMDVNVSIATRRPAPFSRVPAAVYPSCGEHLYCTGMTHTTKRVDDGSAATDNQDEGLAPRNQLWLRSSMNLTQNVSLDVMARYVGRLDTTRVGSYVEGDVRVAWLSPSGLEVAIVGHNLLHGEHVEYLRTLGAIERDVSLELRWRFE